MQDTVTQVVEQKLNGIDNLIYMASTSDSSGAVSITLTFKAGTNPDIAQVQVQNKLQTAVPLLPQIVQQQGISVVKSGRNYMLIVGLVSEDGSLDRNGLTDYMVSNIQDIISRLDGVGELMVFGTQNAMRIWVDPAKLNNFHLTTNDVINALQAQNVQVSAGQFGGTPRCPGAATQRHHQCPVPAPDHGSVRRHHPAHQPRRLHGQAEGRSGKQDRHRELRYSVVL